MASIFLERCYKDGDEFLNHIVRVTVETKSSQSRGCTQIQTKHKPKILNKHCLPACQEVDGICILGQKMSA
jgi:hypothetical protein